MKDNHEKIKISVIIPVYNVGNYLYECMDSIICQSHRNLEIICINDGSTDNSLQILKDYQSRDGRIKIINQENKGVSSARNRGIAIAEGEYVAFVDPDDILELDAYEIALSKIKNDVAILIWGYKAFPDADGWWIEAGKSQNAVYQDRSASAFFDVEGVCVAVWNKLYKNKMLQDNALKFNETLKMAEDVEFNMLSFVRARNIQFIDNELCNYRIKRKNSLTDIYIGEMQADNHKILFKNVLEDWNRLGLLKNNEYKVLSYFTRMSYDVISSIMDPFFRQAYASELLNMFWNYMSEDTKYRLDLNTRDKLSLIQSIV